MKMRHGARARTRASEREATVDENERARRKDHDPGKFRVTCPLTRILLAVLALRYCRYLCSAFQPIKVF